MSGRVVTIRVPGDICRALAKNRQQGRPWGGIYSAKTQYRDLARLMWRQTREAKFAGKVKLSFCVFRGRSLDPDGAMWAMSSLVDGLKGEAFGDDDAAGLEWGAIKLITGKAWAGPMACTEVKIESIEE